MDEATKPEQNQVLRAYVACRDALVRSILKMRARQEDVDDILQETYLRVMNADEQRPIASHKDYLFVVSRNLVLKKLTRQSREITMEINDAMLGDDGVSAAHNLHQKRKFELMNQALSALPENKRRAILLRKYYGLSHEEIARKMNVSVSSVEKYISSGIKECKRSLFAKGYDDDNNNNSVRPDSDSAQGSAHDQ